MIDLAQHAYGALQSASLLSIGIGGLALFLVLGYTGAPLLLWTLAIAAVLLGLGAPVWCWIAFALLSVSFNVRPLRRRLLTRPLMGLLKALRFLPKISDTERIAIEAGTVWVDGELFSGKPNLAKLAAEAYPGLSAEEQAFLDGPVEEVCRMTDDWEVYRRRGLPPEVLDFLKRQRFFGLIIPKRYGGHGFSASCNSAVVCKVASRCQPLSTTVMVPNSLGPAELLIHYGTDAQKDHYLPRLARGEEIPCFALTEPGAGSDAGSMTSEGVVFLDADGELCLRLNFEKRYISLAGISTLIGLAFVLKDPEGLLGGVEDLGITCGLIPSTTPGVDLEQRHDPLGVPFSNSPIRGKDVVVSLDSIIGGVDGIGCGWRMLMESLAAGRGISLPASGVGGVKLAARAAGAYAFVRRQFGVSIGMFEGIQEPLARIGGFAYLLEAARRYTNGALDAGAKPAVVSAIAKYNFTELCRQAINDGMDIMGGAGICRGPRNTLGHAYAGLPISITVEGANILTRTLMIFGQGAIRCHPYAYREISTLAAGDVVGFDGVFWAHLGHILRNGCRSLLLSVTRGRLARSPVRGPCARHYRKLAWASASFAFLADLAMMLLGGDLKRRESNTGRFADIFSWMYLGNAVLRRFEAEGRRPEDRALLDWSMQYAFGRIQEAFDGLYRNLDVPVLGLLFRGPLAIWLRLNRIGSAPSDNLVGEIARGLQTSGAQRDSLTEGIFVPAEGSEGLGRLELALRLGLEAEPVERKIRVAIRAKKLPKDRPHRLLQAAVKAGIIDDCEAELVGHAQAARDDAIQVDSFTADEYLATSTRGRRQASPRESREPTPTVAS